MITTTALVVWVVCTVHGIICDPIPGPARSYESHEACVAAVEKTERFGEHLICTPEVVLKEGQRI